MRVHVHRFRNRPQHFSPRPLGTNPAPHASKQDSRDHFSRSSPASKAIAEVTHTDPINGGVMNRTVRILAGVSVLLVAAAIILGHLGIKEGAGFVPVADPTAILFDAAEEPGALLTGIAMVLLLAGLSMTLATIRCWIQNKSDLGGFSRHATKIIPKG